MTSLIFKGQNIPQIKNDSRVKTIKIFNLSLKANALLENIELTNDCHGNKLTAVTWQLQKYEFSAGKLMFVFCS